MTSSQAAVMPTSDATRLVVSGAPGKPNRTSSSIESETWVTRPSAAAPVSEGVREPARLERRHPQLGRIEGGDHLPAKGARSLVDHRLHGSGEEAREHHQAER